MTGVAVHGPGAPLALGQGAPRTAADLEADARRVAAALAARPAGEVVLICADRYLFAAGMIGAWAAGHAVRLPPNGQPEVVAAAAARPEVRALLHDREGAEGTALPALLAGPDPGGALPSPPADRPLVIMTTSGSTGAHQAWPKTAVQLLGEADLLARLLGVGPGARVLATVPPHHIYGLLFGVLLPLRSGAALIRETPLHGEEVAAALARHAATHLISVPAHLAALAALDRAPPLERVTSSGAPLPAATARALRARHGWRTFEVYGSTETGGIGWREGEEAWTPFPDAAVSADAEGRLLLDSPRIDAGAPRPFAVPDRIALLPDGRFTLLGRIDGVVKVAGKRVSLREVEERLLALPGVRDAAALAQPAAGARGEEIWVAVAAPGWTPERLRAALAPWLDPVTLPRRVRVVAELPREATGKLRRERLRALFDGPAPAVEPAPAPQALEELAPEADEPLPAGEGQEARRLTFTLSPGLRYFEGHFPGYPILPGVAQLDALVLRQVYRLWPGAGALQAIRRLKFTRRLLPGQRIALRLTRDPARGTVAFAIEGPEGRCSEGTLVLAPEAT